MSLYLTLSSLFGGILYYYHYYFKEESIKMYLKKEFYLENKDSFVELNLQNQKDYLVCIQYEFELDLLSKESYEIVGPTRNNNCFKNYDKIFYVKDSKLSCIGGDCFGIVKVYKLN